MKIVTSNGKRTVKISKSEWASIGKQAGWFSDNDVPSEGQYGSGLDRDAMKLLKSYDITSDKLWRYDSPQSDMPDIYDGIQKAKAGDNDALRKALENRFGTKNWLQRNNPL